MAELGVFTNGYITINSVDLSDHARSIRLTYEAESVDDTVMGDTVRSSTGGYKNWTVEAEFNQDFATGEVDATIFALVGTTTAIAIRPDAGAISTSNPEYQGTGLVTSYNPIGGTVGDLAVATVTIVSASTLVRDTTP